MSETRRKPKYNPNKDMQTLANFNVGQICTVFPDSQKSALNIIFRGPTSVEIAKIKTGRNGQKHIITVDGKSLSGDMAARQDW